MAQASDVVAAAQSEDIEKVKALLAADPALAAARDEAGVSALMHALYRRRRDIADLFSSRRELDVFEAAAIGNSLRVAELLGHDPDLANAYAADGFTPLGLAAFFGQRDAVDVLLANGADVNAVSRNVTGYTALTGAVAGGHAEIVAALLARGARADYRYGMGLTPLHEAAASGNSPIVELLLAHGADPSLRADNGKTAADLAVEAGFPEIADLLAPRQR